MICTFILDCEKLKKFYENRDCRDLQHMTHISEEIRSYIEKTSHKKTRLERFAAYSLLFSAAKDFFGVTVKEILRNEFGKPYISEADGGPEIYFSISHSDGICAVSLCDECECGIDVQTLPDENKSERIEKRFLYSFETEGLEIKDIISEPITERLKVDCATSKATSDKPSGLEVSFPAAQYSEIPFPALRNTDAPFPVTREFLYYSSPTENGFSFVFVNSSNKCDLRLLSVEEKTKDEFLKKWTVCEAILKCFGKGFSDYQNLNFLKSECELRYSKFALGNRPFGVALAIRNEIIP